MIRLVTQFDPPQARVVAATPTCGCGCCCCCCSCLATLIGASAYTAASAQASLRYVKATNPERVRWASPWPGVLGALALPITYVVALATWWTVIVPSVVWFALVGLVYRGAGHPRPWRRAAGLVALGSAAFIAEFVVGGYMLTNDSASDDGLYLAGALALGTLFAIVAILDLRRS